MKRKAPSGKRFSLACCYIVWLLFCGLAMSWLTTTDIRAQIAPPITPSGLNTQVGAPINLTGGKVQYDITGGTRPGNGPNLFHSFGEFSVPNNNIANFLNDSGRATSNILGRVTGGNPSNIFGTIQTTGFGNANLFLMNPAGIVFGPNATLNVGGSAHFTTADYLRLADGVRFNAIPNATADALLSTAPVAAFGFLASNPAAISVQGSALSVSSGESISLVGGNISIQAGVLEDGTSQAAHLSAPSGQIRLASVASPGEILHPTLETAPNIAGQTFSTMGTITLSENATIDVSGDAAGTVMIRGGQLVMANSKISADTGNTNGAPTAVDIQLTGDLSISADLDPAITARTTGSGNAGEIHISAATLQTNSMLPDFVALIDSHTSGSGNAGNVSVTTGTLTVNGNFLTADLFIDSGTGGGGNGGNVTISAGNAQFLSTGINTGDAISGGLGSGGNVTIRVDSLKLDGVVIFTDSLNARGGDLTLQAHDITLRDSSFISVLSLQGGSTFTITTDQFAMDSSTILNQTALGAGGGITITAKSVELVNGSNIASQTFGDGDAGSIQVIATDHVTFADSGTIPNPSGLFTNSFGNAGLGTNGNAGAIVVTTPRLEMTGGARINSTTQSNGRGGDVTITATETVSISGERPFDVPSEAFGLGGTRASGIYTRTVGSDFCSGPCGDAGSVTVRTGSLNLGNGAVIDSGTTSTGRGGDVTINATGGISISGTLSDGTPSGIFSRTVDPATGAGGDISLNANQVSLSNGSAISAQSTSSGNAGKISITAADRFVMRDSTVTTQAMVADGGNITIHAGTLVQLINSSITTSVGTGAGNGGNITIDPQFVILQHSEILANAFGGNGGNITIVAGLLLSSPDSVISASSALGVSGTITIDSAISDLSGSLVPLPSGFLKTGALFRSRCSARLAGETTSSFVLASKGGIPTEPGGILISPLPSTNVRSARLSSSSEDMVLRVAPQFAGSSPALPPLGGTCSS